MRWTDDHCLSKERYQWSLSVWTLYSSIPLLLTIGVWSLSGSPVWFACLGDVNDIGPVGLSFYLLHSIFTFFEFPDVSLAIGLFHSSKQFITSPHLCLKLSVDPWFLYLLSTKHILLWDLVMRSDTVERNLFHNSYVVEMGSSEIKLGITLFKIFIWGGISSDIRLYARRRKTKFPTVYPTIYLPKWKGVSALKGYFGPL